MRAPLALHIVLDCTFVQSIQSTVHTVLIREKASTQFALHTADERGAAQLHLLHQISQQLRQGEGLHNPQEAQELLTALAVAQNQALMQPLMQQVCPSPFLRPLPAWALLHDGTGPASQQYSQSTELRLAHPSQLS